MNVRSITGGFFAAALLTTGAAAQLPALELREGEPFPDLVLPSANDGRPASLADFLGERVVLHVFASW